jgi:AmiR/NasT family two-component response regulator
MRRTVSQLQHALDSRVVIEQAKGYVAGRDGQDLDGAFRVLRETARSQRRPVADVAREVLSTR